MIKKQIVIEPKKGCPVVTLWGIRQVPVYPDFDTSCGELRWRNCEGLMTRHGEPLVAGLRERYVCDLLRSDTDEHDISNRCCHAGYVDDYRKGDKPNPGTFFLRGEDMGEMSVTFTGNPLWPEITVRGFNAPTPSERTFIIREICCWLQAHIDENKAQLKAEAIAETREAVRKRVEGARARLDKLEAEMAAAIDKAAL